MKIFILQLVASLILAGCTSKDLYNNIQSNGKRACLKAPPAQYDECIAKYAESYESYKRSRNKLLKDSQTSSH